jgi:phage gpG-like protein
MATEFRVRFGKESAVALEKMLNDQAGQFRNPRGLLMALGTAFLKLQNRRFLDQKDPQGNDWQKLSGLTVMLRGSSGPILRRSGRLMSSGNFQVSGMTLSLGVDTIYARAQQYGATIVPKNAKSLAIPVRAGKDGRNKDGFILLKSVTIPARPMVGFGPREEEAAQKVITAWLKLGPDA